MATERLLEQSKACQYVGESIGDYMKRMRLLVMRAHPDLNHKERERILISNFHLGLRDQELAASLKVASMTTSAEVEQKATDGESARKNARTKKSYSNYLSTDYSEEQFDDGAAGYNPVTYEEGGEDIAAAFNDQHRYRGNALGGRPGRGFGGQGRGYSSTGMPNRGGFKCYRCGQAGHIQRNCTQSASSTRFQPRPVECLICRGSHLIRLCPRFDKMQQWATKFKPNKSAQDVRLTSTGSSQPPRPTQPRSPNPQNSSSFFREDASMTIFNLTCPSEIVEDPAMPSLESTPGNPRIMLFFVRGIVQNKTHWVLADSGWVRNLIDNDVVESLPF